jgi:hypothetical protein
MIKNTDAVKIIVNVKPLHTGEIQVKIERWVEGIGWAHMDMYFTQDEYEQFVDAVGVESARHHRSRH